MAMFMRGQWWKRTRPVTTGAGGPPAAPAEGPSREAAPSAAAGQMSLKVNGWVVYRGITPVATAASQQEAVDAAARYLTDPAGGLMHLRPVLGSELLPTPEAIEPGGRAAPVRSLERLVLAAERAGDTEAADALGGAVRLLQAPQLD